MEPRSVLNVPPRIGSAPLTSAQQAFHRLPGRHMGSYRVGPPRPGGEKQPPLPQHPHQQPQQQAHPHHHHHHHHHHHQQQQQALLASPSPPAAFFDRAAPATAATTAAADSAASSHPADCIYDITEFVNFQHTKESPPKGILAFANDLWKEMPENKESRPEHILSREELFQGESVPSKVMSERKLHNEVLGILGRVGEGNLETMKKELTDLPIRQSGDEEIQQVIQVIFNKSIQPEDSIFVPYYVKLVVHLINDIGENEPAGRLIRNAIIRQCQRTFENAEEAQAQLEREVANLPEEEAELRRIIFAGKQKANINFLGLLFTHGLVREKVVLHILEWLLYGSERKRRIPADYELIHFMNLLVTCGKSFSKEGQEFVPKFRSVLEELMHTHPQRRMQFLLLNTVETIDNNWEPRFGAKAASQQQSQESETERRPLPPIPPRTTVAVASPPNPIPSRDWFWTAVDKFFSTSSLDEVIMLLDDIPEGTRIVYCSSVIKRYITTMRYSLERSRLGEFFGELVNKRVLPMEDVRKALLMHLHNAVEEDVFTDVPRYFYNWAVVVKGGRDVFPPSLHAEFLGILVDRGASRENIVNMVREMHKVQSETQGATETSPKNRLRVLPALLRYTPPLFCAGVADDEGDILTLVYDYDSTVGFFCDLCEQSGSKDAFLSKYSIGKLSQLAFSVISALFTFARFDTDAVCREHKDSLKKLLSSKQLHLLLEEVYLTWLAFDRMPEDSFVQFSRALRDLAGNPKEQIDKFKTILEKQYGVVGKNDASLLDKK